MYRKSTFLALDRRKKGDTKIKIRSKMQKIHRKNSFSALDRRKTNVTQK